MLIPLFILCIGSIFVGFLGKELFLGANVSTWEGVFLVLPWHEHQFESEFLPFYIKVIPVIFSILGGLISYIFYKIYQYHLNIDKNYKKYYNFYHFLSNKWYFDNFYTALPAKTILNFGYNISFKGLDRGLIEVIGPYGIIQMVKRLSNKISTVQTGLIYNYILVMILGVSFLLFLYLIPIYFNIIVIFIYLYLFLFIIYITNNKKNDVI